MVSEYPKLGRYWDWEGNELDVIGIDEKKRRIC